jgi:integrase
MGTIVQRKRKDGSTGYTAQILVKRRGAIVHREAQTFDRKQAAKAWLSRRETELREPGALEKPDDPLLGEVIDRYIEESRKKIGRTKAQVLRTIKKHDIVELPCSKIKSTDIMAFAQALPVQPQTVQNYLSHLAAVFAVAKPAWGYPLDRQAIKDAQVVAKRLGVISKSKSRDRRPTLDELDKLMNHFGVVKARRPRSAPMQKIVVFALFSTRRLEEITRIMWDDYDKDRVLVRDMKHPGDKEGNDTWVELPPEAAAVIDSMAKTAPEIFPFTTDAIGAAFTRACQVLGIDDLVLHDLRHEGISRLFELGKTIPQVAAVSGHRSWQSLKRYTHLRQTGDKYQIWKWKEPAATIESSVGLSSNRVAPTLLRD